MARLRTVVIASVASLALCGAAPAAAEEPPAHEVEHVQVPSHDGVELDGWIVRPSDREGEDLPVVLWSAPYFGQCNYYPFPTPEPKCDYATGDDPELWDNSTHGEAVPVNVLLRHGYAVAMFNVRGTGNSGGCFSWMGADEQRDQAFLVEWLADREWSNGNVGMMGLSYHGTTPWEAAVQNPPALKTIVVAGMIGDGYTFSHTPQGATYSTIGVFDNNFVVRVSLSPPVAGTPEHATVDHVPAVAGRLCPDLARFMTEDMKGLAGARDEAFWAERRLTDRFPDVRAAVLLTHGFQDTWLSGHQAQEDVVWDLLRQAPKRMLEGQWGHDFPNFNTSGNGAPVMTDWNERLLAWLDHWLKRDGRGAAPREGLVDYQDDALQWHTSTSWPPAGVREEVLYLRDGALDGAPGEGEATFRSYPQAEKVATPELLLCEDNLLSEQLGPGGVRFASEPVAAPVRVAGNPFAFLRLSSDLPGGLVSVHLFDLAPDFACGAGTVRGARKLAYGSADLRFHEGNMTGRDFPTGEPTHVRLDITNLAAVLKPGHRLAAAVSYGDYLERTAAPFTPQITVHGGRGGEGSQLVVPIADGPSLGGSPPARAYPPRPFLPDVPATPPQPGGSTPDAPPSSPPPAVAAPAPAPSSGGGPASAAAVSVPAGSRPLRRTAAASLSRRSIVRLSRRGRFAVRVGCPAGAPRTCTGRIVARARVRGRGMVLARRRFAVAPGKRRRVTLRLRPRARRLVQRRGRLRATVTLRPGTTTRVTVVAARTRPR